MENVIFLHQKNIQEISMESRPHEEMGYDYDKHDNYIELGDGILTDVGLVDIETLINNLTQMRSHGATHVGWLHSSKPSQLSGAKSTLSV